MAEDPESHDKSEDGEPNGGRWLDYKGINIFFAVVVGLAIIGFFVGTRSDPYDAQLAGFTDDTDRPDGDAIAARSYSELMESPYFANQHWQRELDRLAGDRPAPTDEVERTPEMTRKALQERTEQRAYEGAPPTVPHPIRERGYAECMACHGEGLRLEGELAPPISHEYMTNCTQCHVPDSGSIPTDDNRYDELPVDNDFAGIERWGSGDRAYAGAPPTMPHPSKMRQNCQSCHGTMARPGLRTTHPWRTQCTQCHAPSATLDQHPSTPDFSSDQQPPPVIQEVPDE